MPPAIVNYASKMLGVLHSAASDFSSFCYPRTPLSPVVCNEVHETSIEERYCPKQHVHQLDDEEWDELLANGIQFFNESESDALFPELVLDSEQDSIEEKEKQEEEDTWKELPYAPPPTPVTTTSGASTPSLVGGNGIEDCLSSGADSGNESEYETVKSAKKPHTATKAFTAGNKRKRGKGSKGFNPRKRLCRNDSANSVSSISSIVSAGSNVSSSTAALLQSMMKSDNPWKCPHCPWVQHTQRLPDFLRHQRSHFVSQSDWPCPNPKCGKGFARKDSLKRHLDNKATGCKRPPGYTIC